jgi:hypothetical protein
MSVRDPMWAAALALVAAPARALAQCPMCGKAAEYAGTSPGQANATLTVAVLVLLVPALAIVGGLAALVWRHRRADGGATAPSTAPATGP